MPLSPWSQWGFGFAGRSLDNFEPQAIAVVGEAAAELFEPYYDHVLSLGMQGSVLAVKGAYPQLQ